MWRFGVAVSFVLVLLLPAASVSDASSHQKAPAKCPPSRSRVVAANNHAQLYEAVNPSGALSVYGCAGHGRSYTLGEVLMAGGHGPFFGVELETLAGSDVAYWEEDTEEHHERSLVIVRDLRTGRVLHKLEVGTPPAIETGDGYATAIVVKSDGSVAWIVGHNFVPVESPGPPPVYEVEAIDQTGRRLLAAGTEISPRSLALVGSTLYWTQGGKPYSAALN
jgi:hypothetical protein